MSGMISALLSERTQENVINRFNQLVEKVVNNETVNLTAALATSLLAGSQLGYIAGCLSGVVVYFIAQNSRLSNRVSILEQDKKILTTANTQAETELELLRQPGKAGQVKEALICAQKQVSVLETSHADLTQQLNEATAKLADLSAKYASNLLALNCKFSIQDGLLLGVVQELADVKTTGTLDRVQELEEEKSKLESQLTSLKEKIASQVTDHEQEVKQLQTDVSQIQKLLETAQKEKTELELELHNLKEIVIPELKNRNGDLESLYEEAAGDRELNDLTSKLYLSQVDSLQKKLDQFRKVHFPKQTQIIKDLKAEMAGEKLIAEEEITELETKVQSLLEEEAAARDLVRKLVQNGLPAQNERIEKLLAHCRNLSAEKQVTHEALQALSQRYESFQTMSLRTIEQLEAQIKSLEST